jgi:hypothetical protein
MNATDPLKWKERTDDREYVFVKVSVPQCVGDRCEKCTKSGRAPEENLVGLAGEQAFSSL